MVKERYDYLSLCITYRMIAALLSTFAYLYTSYSMGERLEFSGWIAIGMLASCFVANFLYNYFGSMSDWGRYVLFWR